MSVELVFPCSVGHEGEGYRPFVQLAVTDSFATPFQAMIDTGAPVSIIPWYVMGDRNGDTSSFKGSRRRSIIMGIEYEYVLKTVELFVKNHLDHVYRVHTLAQIVLQQRAMPQYAGEIPPIVGMHALLPGGRIVFESMPFNGNSGTGSIVMPAEPMHIQVFVHGGEYFDAAIFD